VVTSNVEKRLRRVRELMTEASVDVLVVRATDRYLNEYVPAAESLRLWLTGFTGSTGDALVTADGAFVFVDGRYYLQAEQETDPRHVTVVRVPFGTGIERAVLDHLGTVTGPESAVGFEPEKVTIAERARLEKTVASNDARLVAIADNIVARARGASNLRQAAELEVVADARTGESTAAKLGRVRAELAARGADGLLVTRLDEIAWLTNMRAYEIDYAATFPGLAYVGRDSAYLFVDGDRISERVERTRGRAWSFATEEGWSAELARRVSGGAVLIDPEGTSVAVRDALAGALGSAGEVRESSSIVAPLKARKNAVELATMTDSFQRADTVVAESIRWVNRKVSRRQRVTERDLADEVERRFMAAGARGLSFRVIAAAGKNGAQIHYSNPDPDRRIRAGELVLLDTGGYFEAGYATDLTRTFFAGGTATKPTRKQRTIYTLVLKGAIRGMKAVFPVGTDGVQLDAIVRAPMWEAGYDYLHGTGHGVGVLVHESPPRVATRSKTPLEPGQVLSIEPGIYLEGWGGVRIENLVTVEPHGKLDGWLRIRALTFSPLDRRLIDPKMLTFDEKDWLRRYGRGRV